MPSSRNCMPDFESDFELQACFVAKLRAARLKSDLIWSWKPEIGPGLALETGCRQRHRRVVRESHPPGPHDPDRAGTRHSTAR
eukprot:1421268-Rhodomonas_salina.3